MQSHRPAGSLAGFGHTVSDLHNVFGLHIPTRHVGRSDQKVVVAPTYRHSTVSGNHQTLIAGAADNVAHQTANEPFVGGIGHIHKMADVVGNPSVKFVDLFVAQKPGFTQPAGVDQGTATKLEGFESLIGVHHVGTPQHHSVILEYNGLVF